MWIRTVSRSGRDLPGRDDDNCMVYVSDENGVCEFTLPPYAYEIHTLKVPEGYEGDTETVTTASAEGDELTFTLEKK